MISHRDEKETDLKHAEVTKSWNVTCALRPGQNERFLPGVGVLETSIQNAAPFLLIIQTLTTLPSGWHCLPTPGLGRQSKGTVKDVEVKDSEIQAPVLLPQ